MGICTYLPCCMQQLIPCFGQLWQFAGLLPSLSCHTAFGGDTAAELMCGSLLRSCISAQLSEPLVVSSMGGYLTELHDDEQAAVPAVQEALVVVDDVGVLQSGQQVNLIASLPQQTMPEFYTKARS